MEPASALQQALQSLRTGLPAQARAILSELLAIHPDNAPAQHLLGLALLEEGQGEAAAGQLGRAAVLDPRNPSIHYHLGNALAAIGRHGEAIASFSSAIALRPTFGEALFNLGNAQRALGDESGALASYQRAAQASPQLHQAYNSMASLLHEAGKFDEALQRVQRALQVTPSDPGALSNQAVILHSLKRFDEAAAVLERLLLLGGEDARLLNRLGVALHEAGRVPSALENYDRAISLDASLAEAWNNRGNALHDLRRMEEALASYQRALDCSPDFVQAITNRGLAHQELELFEQAARDYDKAIELRPGHAESFKRRAGLQLSLGRFAEGWSDFSHSIELSSPGSPNAPAWKGEALQGRSILLTEPSGLGDTLQFCRYALPLLEAGARVTFAGPRRLHALLATLDDRIELIVDPGHRRFDYRAALWALPHLLWASDGPLAEAIPYLRADPLRALKWASGLDPDQINIGICWQGNPGRKIDSGRSIPLAEFQPLCRVPGVRLVSLQKGDGLEQMASLPAGMQVFEPGPGFDDGPDAFVDSAALLQSLDLLISADTSIVHLAGALGRPVWVALARVPDWRWMLDRDDSPWYPATRLFRQSARDQWRPVFEAMAAALVDWPSQRHLPTGNPGS